MPKLENILNASSTSTAKLHASSLSSGPSCGRRTRSPSFGFMKRPCFSSEPAMQTPMAPRSQAQTSVGGQSSTLTGYRDAVIGVDSETLACIDHARSTDIPIPGYSRKAMNCKNCGIAIRQLHEEKLQEPSANTMTFGTPPRDFANTTTTGAIDRKSVV